MKYLILATFSILILSSCFRERIDIDLNEENKKFVVTGFISTLDETQFIKVSKTVNYLGSLGIDPVTGANVTLNTNMNTYTLAETEPGTYELPTSWDPVLGADYTLRVEAEGESFTSVHKLRPCPEIENLRQQIDDDVDEEDSTFIYQTLFDFQEIPGEGDAYYGIDYKKGHIAGDSLLNGGFTNDEFIDGQYIEDVELTEDDRLYQIGDTAVVEIYSIGNQTQKFLVDIELEVYRGGPFDPPPANVRTNISGGAIGYFIIADARREEIVIR